VKRKILLLIGLVILYTSFSQICFAENEIVAEEITKSVKITLLSNDKDISQLHDDTLASKYTVKENDVVSIVSDKAFSSVYIRFNKPSKRWLINQDSGSLLCGEYGFMHEFIELPKPQLKIEMIFPEDTVICDISVFTSGEVPDSVEKWTPPLEDADMLLLPTHADDEHIFFGGIMPYYSGELGKKVQVAYLTNHYNEWYRPHELLEGLWHVGIKAYPIIPEQFNDHYSDNLEHAKTLYNLDEMLEYQVTLLRRFKPEVVIAHDINGEYGHGVHMLNTNLLIQALEISNDERKYEKSSKQYGIFDVPKTYIHLYDKNQIVMDVDTPLSNFSGKTAHEMAVDGFAKHKSQGKYFTVEKSGKYDCRKFGLYRTTVGDDIEKKDFFENIKYTPPKIEVPVSSNETQVEESTSSVTSSKPDQKEKKSNLFNNRSAIFVILGAVVIIMSFRSMHRKRK